MGQINIRSGEFESGRAEQTIFTLDAGRAIGAVQARLANRSSEPAQTIARIDILTVGAILSRLAGQAAMATGSADPGKEMKAPRGFQGLVTGAVGAVNFIIVVG